MATFFTHGVEEFSFTSGTGPYALAGATPNMRTFADKVPDQSAVTYKAWDGARSEYGYGIFEYPSTLHRRAIISSSNGDQVVDWQVDNQRLITLVPDPVFSGEVVVPDVTIPEVLIPCPFPVGECAQALIKTGPECHDVEWQWRPYPIAAWIDGAPSVSQKIRLAVTENLRFDADFAGSYAYCGEVPDDDFVITLNRIAPDDSSTTLGTVRFDAYGSSLWATTTHDVQYLAAGDRLEYLFPSDPDEIEDISVTARAVIVCSVPDTTPDVFEGSDCIGEYAGSYTKDADQTVTGAPDIVTWVCSPSPAPITRIYIPSDWDGRYVRLSANLEGNGFEFEAEIRQNGSTFQGMPRKHTSANSPYNNINIHSAIIPAIAADYFEVFIPYVNRTTDITDNVQSWFAVEKKATDFNGALVFKSGQQAVPVTTNTTLTFEQEAYDLAAWHDSGSNNSRLTVPSGVSLVRVQAGSHTTTTGADVYGHLLQKNGSGFYGQAVAYSNMNTQTASSSIVSAIIAVSPGDYFTTVIFTDHPGGVTINNDELTWFQIEAIPASTKYALVRRTSNQAVAAGVPTIINWDAEEVDTDGFHDNSTNPSRLTVPSGITQIRLCANIANAAVAGSMRVQILKNGAEFAGTLDDGTLTTGSLQRNNGMTKILDVSPGDYFEIEVTNSFGSVVGSSMSSWFSIEEVVDPG